MLINDFDFCVTFQLSVLNIPNFSQDDLVQAELFLVIIHNINAKRTRPGAFSNAKMLRGTTSIHSERAKASNKMTKPETKDLTKNLDIINAIICLSSFLDDRYVGFPECSKLSVIRKHRSILQWNQCYQDRNNDATIYFSRRRRQDYN